MIHINKNKKAMTLVEILVAIAISLAFLSGVLMAFTQILKTSDLSKARLQAVNNARSAVEIMAMDIKQARIDYKALNQTFLGTDENLPYGNGLDDDRDGEIDEEFFDGQDGDSDWNTARDDKHQNAGSYFERSKQRNMADLGDFRVDEDCKFSRDTITFRIFPDPANPSSRDDLITYEVVDDIASFGEPNVLIRRITRNYSTGSPTVEVAPVAFNILSLDLLYWDPNSLWPYWVSTWNASTILPYTNKIPLPISVYIAITTYAGTDDIKKIKAGDKIDTISLHTIVNIEQILNDSRWR